MGPEIYYEGGADLNCPKCGGYIQVRVDASEYPIGTPQCSEMHIEGANLTRGFEDIDVIFVDELYFFDKKYQLYVAETKQIITDLQSGVSDLLLEISRTPTLLHQITPRQFEELIARIFSLHGFNVELTKRTRDGGKDIVAIRSDLGIRSKYIIECKRYAPNKPVGVALVRGLYGAQTQMGANKAVLATTSRFTTEARSFAETLNTTKWAMDLKDFRDICEWVRDSAAN
ncbi:MAG: restriction endonuclease [Nitrospira sp.]